MIDSVDLHQRSSFRTTSLSPDHVSSTAQTLTSTNPSGSATSRIASSVTSVGTLAAFFGHETHTIARGSSLSRNVASARASVARLVAKTWTTSVDISIFEANCTDGGSGSSNAR